MDDPTAGFDNANTAGFTSTLRAFTRLLRPEQVVIATHDERVAAMLAEELAGVDGWPESAYDGTRRAQAALKNLTSDLIGRFCGSVQEATFAASDGPFVRYAASRRSAGPTQSGDSPRGTGSGARRRNGSREVRDKSWRREVSGHLASLR